jgi:hypothetical protein
MKMKCQQVSCPSWLRAGCACLALAIIAVGCVGSGKKAPKRAEPVPQPSQATPAASQFGPAPAKIVSMNPELQFVVIDFSSRVMPAVGSRLNVYRGDKAVGVVRITEPVRARLATADVLQGEVRVGDGVR